MSLSDFNTPRKLSFLDLPPELRNAIYTYALVQPTPITLPYAYDKSPRAFLPEPALLHTSRHLRAEATPIFYGSNVFAAPSPAAARAFLASLSEAKIAWLRMFRPVEMILPRGTRVGSEVHGRWLEGLRGVVNRLVSVDGVGRGLLSKEAVWVPAGLMGAEREEGENARSEGNVEWVRVGEVERFVVKEEDDEECVADENASDEIVALKRRGAEGRGRDVAKRSSWSLEWRQEGE